MAWCSSEGQWLVDFLLLGVGRCSLSGCGNHPYQTIEDAKEFGSYCDLCDAWGTRHCRASNRPARPSLVSVFCLEDDDAKGE